MDRQHSWHVVAASDDTRVATKATGARSSFRFLGWLFEVVLGEEVCSELADVEGDPESFAMCTDGCEAGLCSHARGLRRQVEAVTSGRHAELLVRRLGVVCGGRWKCKSCTEWLAFAVEMCSAALDREVQSRAWCSDVTAVVSPNGQQISPR